MRFSGTVRVRAPAKGVWDLLANPEALPRFVPAITRVHLLSGGAGEVGAQSYTVVHASGRSRTVAGFVSVCEPERRLAGAATAGMYRTTYDYHLSAVNSDEPRGYRDAVPPPATEVRWFASASLRSPALWLLMPFVLFLPLIVVAIVGRETDKIMTHLARVAEADVRAK